ncbi:uncharacterized protein V6R79_014092 [Siganus canaliculatus]
MLLKMTLGFFTLYCLFAVNYGLSDGRETRVEEGSDAVLRCSLGNQDLRPDRFQWVKDDGNDRKRAFGYVQGKHSNNGLKDQHQQFKGHVSHFGDELQHGNASIKIHNTKMEDSGDYICSSDRHEQIFRVQLVVDAAPPLHTKLPDVRPLLCDIQGSRKSECQCSVHFLSTVNQSDRCLCVVTDASELPWGKLLIAAFVGLVLGVLVTVAAQRIRPVVSGRCANDNVFGRLPDTENTKINLEKGPSSTTDSSPQ